MRTERSRTERRSIERRSIERRSIERRSCEGSRALSLSNVVSAILTAALVAGAVFFGALGSRGADAQTTFELTLVPPETLAIGDRADLIATVRVPAGDRSRSSPLLLTPVSEGSAVEVVRGRLLRADADRDPDAERLRFRIPLVARTAGTAVLRVHARSFVCPRSPNADCHAVTTERSAVVRVRGSIDSER
jgi:hypothetical protein